MWKVRPLVWFFNRRKSGISYKIPVAIKVYKANKIAIFWLIKHALLRHEKTVYLKLFGE